MIDRRLLKTYKIEIGTSLVLGGIALCAYFFIFQASKYGVFEKETQWKESRGQLEKILRQKKVERDLEQFINLLEDQQNYADVINGPMVIAKKFKLNVPSVSYQKENVEQDFLRVSFAFSVTGRYESIREFIAAIESAKTLYVIEDMSLGKSNKEGNLLELQVKMTTLLRSKS